jgi:predicted transcriptional regulator
MRVQDIMTRAVVSATPQSSVLDLATLMLDNRVSAIPVISGCCLVGIVSEADLLHRYELGTQRDAGERPCGGASSSTRTRLGAGSKHTQ